MRALMSKMAGIGVSLVLCAMAWGASAASAVPVAAGWKVDSFSAPTVFSEAQNGECAATFVNDPVICDSYRVTVVNVGAAATDSTPVTIADTLPAGVVVKRVEFYWTGARIFGLNGSRDDLQRRFPGRFCSVSPSPRCTLPYAIGPDERMLMVVDVTVSPGAPEKLANAVSVSGGGAPEAGVNGETPNGGEPAQFGLSDFDFFIDGANGLPDTQAAAHPYEMTTTIGLNSEFREGPDGKFEVTGVQDLKDVVVDLPLGFAGSTLAAPECTLAQLSGRSCPPDTVIGHLFTEPESVASVDSPIYNLVPERGYPAEFGYVDLLDGSHVFYVKVVPTPQGYVLQSINRDTPQVTLDHIIASFYGDPAERDGTGNAAVPFFTDPAHCDGTGLTAKVWVDSWQTPGSYTPEGLPNLAGGGWVGASSQSPPVTGCDLLTFTPSIVAQPTVEAADSPTGLEFEMRVPQFENPLTNATPSLDNATVVFPEGMTVDPSSGQGLAACSAAQIGWLGGTPQNFDAAPPQCPEDSKIGTLELETPLLPNKLEGQIYLAAQNENPFGSVFGIYVVVNDPVNGVVLKIAGELKSDPQTGRLTSFFPENAQLPFSDLKLHFSSGPRAPLATPEACGTYTTTSVLEPWSAPDSGPNAEPTSSFQVNGGCVSGFHPSFAAGSSNLQAGANTAFVASFSRGDEDQQLAGLTVTLPPGLVGNVGSVPECPQADIEAAQHGTGTCPAATEVGTVTAFAGPGPNPLQAVGHAYLTGPYNGGPFGLAVVVPAIAGPFNLGNVVVRQSLRIDPTTAQVTDVSDPLPTFLDPIGSNGEEAGIPIRLRRVDVNVDRPGFMLNPTNCAALPIDGTISSANGTNVAVSSHFQVTNCATLAFKPSFKVSSSGKTSRSLGASLNVKLTYPKAAFGSQANIAKVKVDLPKQLPSNIKALQHACPHQIFEANPAACPAESRVGTATATTPILSTALSGPAYFVSHGGAKFPELIIVLQGQGITVDLHGETFINEKTNITSSTFNAVPDVPVGMFELNLPQGQYSALAAPSGLCNLTKTALVKRRVSIRVKGRKRTVTRKLKTTVAAPLVMPTAFTAQNGAVIRQNTPIDVTGCGKVKKKAKGRRRG
ncbi:MAG: hypothetical protein ACRDK4_04105 [Solirubrobacteraceae bacterium]